MTDRIEEIRARVEAATPGPWERKGDIIWHEYEPNEPFSGPPLVVRDDHIAGGNADFIAHVREDIPYLLARIEELEATIFWLRDGLEWIAKLHGHDVGAAPTAATYVLENEEKSDERDPRPSKGWRS